MFGCNTRRNSGAALIAVIGLTANAWAQLEVKTVPWRGNPGQPHQVFSGGTLTLQGVASVPVGCTLSTAVWDPGDGSAPINVSFATPRVLEATHTYTGLNNQPYVATLTVTDSCGNQASDTFRIVVLPQTLDVDVNMAVDRGLWYLHKREVLSSVGGVPTGYWSSQNTAAATASALQAFAVHGHTPTGNVAEDPYVDDVTRGIAHLMTELQTAAISAQPAGDPDSNGNGLGIYVPNGSNPIYVGGQVLDGIVACGTPTALATTGVSGVIGRTHADIVQDMIDMFAWGQSENGSARGGWRYSFNADSDNSAAQWMAIGGIAAERNFGTLIPAFVRTENLNYWLAYSQYRDGTFASWDGHFGYGGQFSIVDIQMMNTTPSGIVQLDFDNVPSSDARFDAAQAYMARNWTWLTLNNRIYGMFATAKAFRLSLPNPVHTLSSGTTVFDWYRAQTSAGDPVDGLARRLVSIQQGDGSWDGYWVADDVASAWAAIVLSSSIVSVGPVAVAKADPETTAATFPITFNGAFSYHPDANRVIVNYEWDFESDGTYDATGVSVVHSYAAQGNYVATLRVTDDTTPVALQATNSVTVHITPPPFPPNSNPGGPYVFCPAYQPWILDGTASSDPDGSIVLYEWDFDPQPLDLDFNDAFGPTVDVTSFFQGLGPGVYDAALRVTDDLGNTNTDFTTVRILPAGVPCPGQAPILTCPPDFTEIWAGGIPAGQADPNHTGTATYQDACTLGVQLTYNDISVVPNTPQNPGAPEVVITRRWTLSDGCGNSTSCDQTITLTSPSGQSGFLTLDMFPNHCPNDIAPITRFVDISLPGTWTHSAFDIDPASIEVRRADGVGAALTLGRFITSYGYADVTRPYYGQTGPCGSLGPDGRADLTLRASARALRVRFELNQEPDGQLVTVIVTGRTYAGEPISVTDWIVSHH